MNGCQTHTYLIVKANSKAFVTAIQFPIILKNITQRTKYSCQLGYTMKEIGSANFINH